LGGRIDISTGARRSGVTDYLEFAGENLRVYPKAEGRQRAELQWDDPQQQMTLKGSQTATMVVAVGIPEIGVNRWGSGHG
jgi:hypothetical protein